MFAAFRVSNAVIWPGITTVSPSSTVTALA
jgi:hypothetical protein